MQEVGKARWPSLLLSASLFQKGHWTEALLDILVEKASVGWIWMNLPHKSTSSGAETFGVAASRGCQDGFRITPQWEEV